MAKQRECFVPLCTNSKDSSPEKLFFQVPREPETRQKWLSIVGRTDKVSKTYRVCCQDHFDLPNDMVNYVKYQLTGAPIVLKSSVVPHIFTTVAASVSNGSNSTTDIVASKKKSCKKGSSGISKKSGPRKSSEYDCALCQMHFTADDQRLQHITEVHYKPDVNYLCKSCNINFPSNSELVEHIVARTCNTKEIRCRRGCGIFLYLEDLNAHNIEVHRETRQFDCDLCPNTFDRADRLKNHRLMAHLCNQESEGPTSGEEGGVKYCHRCSNEFSSVPELLRHYFIEHEQLKPFKCAFPMCTSYFTTIRVLEHHHSSKHTSAEMKVAIDLFSCHKCHKSLADMEKLMEHYYYEHVLEGKVICDVCSDHFYTKHGLKTHLQVVHRRLFAPTLKNNKSLVSETCSGKHESENDMGGKKTVKIQGRKKVKKEEESDVGSKGLKTFDEDDELRLSPLPRKRALPEDNSWNDESERSESILTMNEDTMKSAVNKFYKYCVVPLCKSTTVSAPEKLFFSVPRDSAIRAQWLDIMGRKSFLSPSSSLHCCEDHFNVEDDTENYVKHKIMAESGVNVFLKLKKGVVPHVFDCQRRLKSSPPPLAKDRRLQKEVVKKSTAGTLTDDDCDDAMDEKIYNCINQCGFQTRELNAYDEHYQNCWNGFDGQCMEARDDAASHFGEPPIADVVIKLEPAEYY